MAQTTEVGMKDTCDIHEFNVVIEMLNKIMAEANMDFVKDDFVKDNFVNVDKIVYSEIEANSDVIMTPSELLSD